MKGLLVATALAASFLLGAVALGPAVASKPEPITTSKTLGESYMVTMQNKDGLAVVFMCSIILEETAKTAHSPFK